MLDRLFQSGYGLNESALGGVSMSRRNKVRSKEAND